MGVLPEPDAHAAAAVLQIRAAPFPILFWSEAEAVQIKADYERALEEQAQVARTVPHLKAKLSSLQSEHQVSLLGVLGVTIRCIRCHY